MKTNETTYISIARIAQDMDRILNIARTAPDMDRILSLISNISEIIIDITKLYKSF